MVLAAALVEGNVSRYRQKEPELRNWCICSATDDEEPCIQSKALHSIPAFQFTTHQRSSQTPFFSLASHVSGAHLLQVLPPGSHFASLVSFFSSGFLIFSQIGACFLRLVIFWGVSGIVFVGFWWVGMWVWSFGGSGVDGGCR